jgi:hypothetical protein
VPAITRLLLILAAVLPLSGCGVAAQVWVSAGASYLASLNGLGVETLKFIDDKEARARKTPDANAPQTP